jgi:hypothetical protein
MIKHRFLGPFLTQVHKHNAEKKLVYTSRRVRKGLSALESDIAIEHISKARLTHLISILFMIGSLCFAFASFLNLQGMSGFSVSIVYFIGSIFFTSAAYSQLLESINYDITSLHESKEWRFFDLRWHNLGYLSALTQFIGTILFNFNTFDALYSYSVYEENIEVWLPNAFGSVLFLVSSFFAWSEIYHDNHLKRFISITWWIIWVNIFGSIFFGISAVESFTLSNGDMIEANNALLQTFLGACCFFIGAFLLLFEND